MHHRIVELLSAYYDGELSDERRAEVEVHLQSCATCRERLAELQALSNLLSAYSVEVGAAEDFWQKLSPRLPVRQQIRPSAPLRAPRLSNRPWVFLPPLGLLFSKMLAQAVMIIAVTFWGVYALGLLPEWMTRSLNTVVALSKIAPRGGPPIPLPSVLPGPLSSLLKYAIGPAAPIASAVTTVITPALIYAVATGAIALLYLAWMALWWRSLRPSPAANGG